MKTLMLLPWVLAPTQTETAAIMTQTRAVRTLSTKQVQLRRQRVHRVSRHRINPTILRLDYRLETFSTRSLITGTWLWSACLITLPIVTALFCVLLYHYFHFLYGSFQFYR